MLRAFVIQYKPNIPYASSQYPVSRPGSLPGNVLQEQFCKNNTGQFMNHCNIIRCVQKVPQFILYLHRGSGRNKCPFAANRPQFIVMKRFIVHAAKRDHISSTWHQPEQRGSLAERI